MEPRARMCLPGSGSSCRVWGFFCWFSAQCDAAPCVCHPEGVQGWQCFPNKWELQGWSPQLLCLPSVPWNGSLEVLNNVPQSHWREMGLAPLQGPWRWSSSGRAGAVGWICVWWPALVPRLSQGLREGQGLQGQSSTVVSGQDPL